MSNDFPNMDQFSSLSMSEKLAKLHYIWFTIVFDMIFHIPKIRNISPKISISYNIYHLQILYQS